MTASSLIGLSSLAVSPTYTPKYNGQLRAVSWLGLGSSGMGNPVGGGADNTVGSNAGAAFGSSTMPDLATYSDKSVQFSGTFSSVISSAQLLGSNDGGANWFPLKDANGNVITMSSPGLVPIVECVEQILPVTPGGSSLTAVNCYLYMRKPII